MINDFEFFHGVVFTRIIHFSQKAVSIGKFLTSSNASYAVDETTGLYIKHSSKRMSPWRFNFIESHRMELLTMEKSLQKLFVFLICNDDGIACLRYSELKSLFNAQCISAESIAVVRHKRQMYTIKGSNGDLGFKIGQSEFPGKIFAAGLTEM